MILDDKVIHKCVNGRELSIYTFRNQDSSISPSDYLELLHEYLNKENMSFVYAYYEYENENGYSSCDSIYDINDIREIISSYLYDVDSYFTDDENNYKLSYSPAYNNIIQLTISKRVDLWRNQI